MLGIIVLLTVTLPLAWMASEFQPKRWIRVALGSAAIAMSFVVAYGVGSFERFNANAWFGAATKSLVDTTIEKLEAGETAEVVTEMKWLQSQYEPTYEGRARYDHLVEEYVARLSNAEP